jgi:hypothetical protein
MMTHKPVVSEEMKQFLQDGRLTYGDALLALSEFRRQVSSRLQTVLDEFSTSFSGLGLSVADFKLVSEKLDDPKLSGSDYGVWLKKHHGADLYSGCSVEWDVGEPKDEQVWVGVWIYAGKVRTDRDRFFDALQKQRSPLSKTDLEKGPDGSSILSSSCDPDQFYSFDETFRTVIKEWVGLLSGDDIKPFLHTPSAPQIQPDDEAA